MGEKSAKKRRRGGTISEEDITILFQRYSATTVLALLQEVGQSSAVKIDWEGLVRKTATGISNAREYQMVWRHLAYRHGLGEKIEVGAEPLEDDSDLEYDLDASPPVSAEASAEAAACVKVLISSGLPSVANMANGSAVEASMTINVPNAQSSKAACGNILPSSSIQGTNITVPVSIQKQSSAGIASEAGETTGDNSQAHRKRRKKVWAEEEDIKLVAAVKQCGEGNWAGMAKEHFKGDRTPGQLYQRWTTMKRKNNSEAGGTDPLSSQKYEQAMATRRAIDMALKDSSFTSAGNSNRAVGNGAATSSNPTTVNASGVDHSSAKKDPTSQKQPHHQVPIPSASKAAVSGPPPMPRPPLTIKSPVNPTLTSDSMVKAAARAAGARIASKSEATIFKETQSKKVVHFPQVKPSGTGAGSLLQTVSVPGHPNVKIFRSAASTTVPATFTPLPVAQANLPRPPTSAMLPQSATTVATTPSPVAAGSHRAEINGPRLAAPPVVPQSVKPAPAPSVAITVVLPRPLPAPAPAPSMATTAVLLRPLPAPAPAPSMATTAVLLRPLPAPAPASSVATTAVLPRPLHQPLRAPVASSTIMRPGIPSAETVAATCSPSTDQGKLPMKVAGPPHASVKAAGIVKVPAISSLQAPAATCSPPIRPQGNQALKAVGPIPVPSSATKLNDMVQKNGSSLQKLNPVQPALMSSKVEAAVENRPAAGPPSTKALGAAAENGHKISCNAVVQGKDTNANGGIVVQGHRVESLNDKPKVLPSSIEGVSVVKNGGVEGSKACS
ncbi:hypothetical protein Drorol1_Dr00011433 [Drosera rotundifolia]